MITFNFVAEAESGLMRRDHVFELRRRGLCVQSDYGHFALSFRIIASFVGREGEGERGRKTAAWEGYCGFFRFHTISLQFRCVFPVHVDRR